VANCIISTTFAVEKTRRFGADPDPLAYAKTLIDEFSDNHPSRFFIRDWDFAGRR
jgi:hypothetical protein